jgi:hypothetical protein
VAAPEQRGNDLVDRVLFAEDNEAQRLDEARNRRLGVLDGSRIEQGFGLRDHGCAQGLKYFLTAL